MPPLYQRWLQVSTFYLERARELSSGGYTIDGLGDFRLAVEEAQCLLDAIDFEPRIRPIEELIPMARPNNPRPARYKD